MARLSRSTWQGIFLAAGTVAVAGLLYAARGILLPFGAALFLVYVTEPLVVRMEQRQMPRVVALLVIYSALAMLVWVGVAYLWPVAASEAHRAVETLPQRLGEARRLAERLAAMGRNRRVPAVVTGALTALAAELQRTVSGIGRRAVTITLSFFSRLALLLLAPVIAFYVSKDLPRLRRELLTLFPPPNRPDARRLLAEVNDVLGGYVRGQLVISSFVGLVTWLGLEALGIPYALLIGIASRFSTRSG